MHSILSLFPNFFTYQIYAQSILHIVVGAIFIYFAYDKYQRRKENGGALWNITALIELIAGILLFIGLYTQAAALVLLVIMVIALTMKLSRPSFRENTPEFFILMIAALIALLLLPPGLWSFDLPL